MTDIDRKRLARDIARDMDRRKTRRRVAVLVLLVAAAIAAVMFLRCGSGLGLGGSGKETGKRIGSAITADPRPTRCAIRLARKELTVDGKRATRAEAVKVCKLTSGAEVLITGDARQGDWDDLRAALEAANIPYLTREPRGAAPGGSAGPSPTDH